MAGDRVLSWLATGVLVTLVFACGPSDPVPGSSQARRAALFTPFEARRPGLFRVDRRARATPAVPLPYHPVAPFPTGEAWAMSCGPDGTHVAAALDDGSVALIDASSGELIRRLGALDHGYDTLRFSRDGARLLTVAGRSRVEVREVSSGRRLLALPERPRVAAGFCGVGDGIVVAYPEDGGTRIERWSLGDTGGPRARLHIAGVAPVEHAIHPLACHPIEPRFALATSAGVSVYQLDDGAKLGEFSSRSGGPTSLDYRRDGQRVAFHAGDVLYLADTATGAVTSMAGIRASWPVRFSSSGRFVSVEGRVHDAERLERVAEVPLVTTEGCVLGEPERLMFVQGGGLVSADLLALATAPTPTGHTGSIRSLQIDPSGAWLASEDDDHVLVWSLARGEVAWAFPSDMAVDAGRADFGPGAELFLIEDGMVNRRELRTGARTGQWWISPFVHDLALARDGRALLLADRDQRFAVVATGDGGIRRLAPPFADDMASVRGALSPTGEVVAVASSAPEATRLISVKTGDVLHTLPSGAAVAFAPDGAHVAVAGRGRVSVHEVMTGEAVARAEIAADVMAFSADGQCLGWGNESYRVGTWCWRTGAATTMGAQAPWHVRAVAWTPDGARLLSGGADSAVHLWNPDSGERTRILPSGPSGTTHTGRIRFTPDGEGLATFTPDGNLRVIDLDSGEVRATYLHDKAARAAPVPLVPGPQSAADNGDVGFAKDGAVFAIDRSGRVRRWSRPGAPARVMKPPGHINSLGEAVIHDGRLAAITSGFGDIQIFRLSPHRRVANRVYRGSETGLLRFSPDGRRLAFVVRSYDTDGVIARVLDSASGKQTRVSVPMLTISGMAFHGPDQVLVLGVPTARGGVEDEDWETGEAPEVFVWNLTTGRLRPSSESGFKLSWVFGSNPTPTPEIATSAEHGLVALHDGDQLLLFDRTGAYRAGLSLAADRQISWVEFHATRPLVATGDTAGHVVLWDFKKREMVLEFRGYNDGDWRTRRADGAWRYPATSPRFAVQP